MGSLTTPPTYPHSIAPAPRSSPRRRHYLAPDPGRRGPPPPPPPPLPAAEAKPYRVVAMGGARRRTGRWERSTCGPFCRRRSTGRGADAGAGRVTGRSGGRQARGAMTVGQRTEQCPTVDAWTPADLGLPHGSAQCVLVFAAIVVHFIHITGAMRRERRAGGGRGGVGEAARPRRRGGRSDGRRGRWRRSKERKEEVIARGSHRAHCAARGRALQLR